MNYNTVYFSPTETTKKVVEWIAKDLTETSTSYDLTNRVGDADSLVFDAQDCVIIGIPVYGGRVPPLIRDTIAAMQGNKTPAVLIATFGNRHYDDSLLELKNIVQSKGFLVIAAAAFVTEHSIIRKFGAGRPNQDDIVEIHNFAKQVKSKIEVWDKSKHVELNVKGNSSYREYHSLPISPHATWACNRCGVCAKQCPAKAIPTSNPRKTDKDKCITCMRCTRVCPNQARSFSFVEMSMAERTLAKVCTGYKQSEIFL